MTHNCSFIYFEIDELIIGETGRHDPDRAAGLLCSDGKVKDLLKVEAMRKAGLPVALIPKHPKTGRPFYQIGSGLFESDIALAESYDPVNSKQEAIENNTIMDLYIQATKF